MTAIMIAQSSEVIIPSIGLREILLKAPQEMKYIPYARKQTNFTMHKGFYLENLFIWLGYRSKDLLTGAGDMDLTFILPKGRIHLPATSPYECGDFFNEGKSGITLRGEFSSLDKFPQTLSSTAFYMHQGDLSAFQFGHACAFGRTVQLIREDHSEVPSQSSWFEESLYLLKLASTKYSYVEHVQNYLGRKVLTNETFPKENIQISCI